MILPDWIVLYLAVAGVCAYLLSARRLALSLATPAVLRWMVYPLVRPLLDQIPVVLLVVASLLVLVFSALQSLGVVLKWFYGSEAGGHVTGTYLVRIIDASARGLMFCLALPFRLLARLLRSL